MSEDKLLPSWKFIEVLSEALEMEKEGIWGLTDIVAKAQGLQTRLTEAERERDAMKPVVLAAVFRHDHREDKIVIREQSCIDLAKAVINYKSAQPPVIKTS